MPTPIFDQPIKGFFGSEQVVPPSDANITTSRVAINKRNDAAGLMFEAAAAIRLGFGPRLTAMYWHDVSADRWYDLVDPSRDIRDRAQTGEAVFTLAAADALYLCFNNQTSGVDITHGVPVNNNAATITIAYGNNAKDWTTFTGGNDGCASGGAMFAQTGSITWALPAAGLWLVNHIRDLVVSANYPVVSERAFWIRITPSALLDTVRFTQLSALTRTVPTINTMDSSTADMGFFKANQEYTVNFTDEIGTIEFIAQTNSDTTANFSWLSRSS